MTKLWQLKKISTQEALNEPQVLPENWGPIFGLQGFENQLNDLSWLGESYMDMGWFVVGERVEVNENFIEKPNLETRKQIAREKVKELLLDSDWTVLLDAPITAVKRNQWIEYRRNLRDVSVQTGFPDDIVWPKKPV